MNSFTSSSEPESPWRRFTVVFLASAALVLSSVLAAAFVLDPYDTGRPGLVDRPGVRPQGPRTAAASRGRDPSFDAAIFGNSHIQLISPERLDRKTGLTFVQLSVPGTGPREQLVLIDWFLRSRPAPPKALVVAADLAWCTPDPDLPNERPFPFWLFERDPLRYIAGLLRFDVLEELPPRLRYVLGVDAGRARTDGYWDYEDDFLRNGFRVDEALRGRLAQRVPDDAWANRSGRFPAAAELRALAASLPAETAFILVFPPVHGAALPRPGTVRDAGDRACKKALAEAAAAHPRSAVVDWRRDRPENHSVLNFIDQTHFRRPLAEKVEDEIADASKHVGLVAPAAR
jgi:hypothetical protein